MCPKSIDQHLDILGWPNDTYNVDFLRYYQCFKTTEHIYLILRYTVESCNTGSPQLFLETLNDLRKSHHPRHFTILLEMRFRDNDEEQENCGIEG